MGGRVIHEVHAPSEQDQGHRAQGGRHHQDAVPARRRRGCELYREAADVERLGPVRHMGPVGRRVRGGIGNEVEDPPSQVGRKLGHRERAEQRRRAEVAVLEFTAQRTALAVPPDPPAQEHGLPVARAAHDGGQPRAVLPLRLGHQRHAQRPLEPGASPRRQRLGLAAGHAENGPEFGAGEPVAQVQFADLPLHRVQFRQRGAYQGAKLFLLRDFGLDSNGGKLRGVVHRLGSLVERSRGDGGLRPSMTLVAGDGEQPCPQHGGLRQLRDLGRGDDEGVRRGDGRIGGLGEPGPAVVVQFLRVTIERRQHACGVVGCDGGDNVAIVHGRPALFHLPAEEARGSCRCVQLRGRHRRTICALRCDHGS